MCIPEYLQQKLITFNRLLYAKYSHYCFPILIVTATPNVQTGSGAYQASYSVGTAVISQGVKKLVHKGDHLTPPTVEVRNE